MADGGYIQRVCQVDASGNPATGGLGGVDAFARQRVSEPFTLFDSKQLYDDLPLFWDENITNGSGNATSTHVAADACVNLYCEPGDTIIRQTFQRFNYQPGKSQKFEMTSILTRSGTGVAARIGLYDGTNGVYFASIDGVIYACRSKGGVETKVAQSAWNIDTMDGSGPSGLTLDPTKVQIMLIDFEWLGVGSVAFAFVINRTVHYVHFMHHANILTSVYMSTPNLPLRYQLAVTSGAGTTMSHICCTIESEGGVEETGVYRYDDMAAAVNANTAGTWYALKGIQLKSTHLGALVVPKNVSLLAITNDNIRWALFLNPTVAGTFTYGDVANSPVQTATGDTAANPSTNTVTGGTRVAGGYIRSGESVETPVRTALRIGSKIDGTRDTLVLAATSIGGSNSDIAGGIGWLETV